LDNSDAEPDKNSTLTSPATKASSFFAVFWRAGDQLGIFEFTGVTMSSSRAYRSRGSGTPRSLSQWHHGAHMLLMAGDH
jgi:hypothetical protein